MGETIGRSLITSAVPPVVPPGSLATLAQPVLALAGDVELRPWRVSDADALVAAGQDPAIRRWNLLVVASAAEARERIARMGARWRHEQGAIWAIARSGGGPAVGLIGLDGLDLAGGSAEILYWLLPAGRGRGAAVEATRRLSRWAFDDLGLHRLRLCHATANEASCRVATKAGFAVEGTMRSALLHEDGWHDQHLHARIRDGYPTAAR
ncbi:GNAT family N-acetyltransferase [Asanoa siamensis]|uniref:Acetyltransferase n=1 Tax=Asanoa siamensis TaxID=926357 RepID=A0ABQ4CTN0_9ACTN|nr:GNAT family N-acetyltransferase [Asanoa siamensis]GIF74642.1 acetyltransferase [Asanoa siamensis]